MQFLINFSFCQIKNITQYAMAAAMTHITYLIAYTPNNGASQQNLVILI